MKVFFKNEYGTVFQEDKDVTVLQYFQKVPDHEAFLELNQPIIDAYNTNPTQILIADIREMGILSVDAQKWVSNTLLPTVIEKLAGKMLYHIQYLKPNEILSKVSAGNVKRFAESSNKNFVLVQYNNQEELNEGLLEFKKLIE